VTHCPIPCDDSQPFIFVSYAHRDSDRVFPIIEYLQSQGYPVWFDEGIDPGSEWDEMIAMHVKKCACMLAMISEAYIASDNCRDELNFASKRKVAVLDPIKVVITNYPEDKTEYFELPDMPQNEDTTKRSVPFTRELYIDRSDFAEVPPPKFFRLKPDGEVRLMGAYIIKFEKLVKDENGEIVEIHCTADLESGNGNPVDGRKIKGTIHWLSAKYALDTQIRVYDKLFTLENVFDIPEDKSYTDYLNPSSLTISPNAKAEPSLADAVSGDKFQFVRQGYFCKDSKYDNTYDMGVPLKDSYKA